MVVQDLSRFQKYNFKTVAHVGANVGEEIKFYRQINVQELFLFEPREEAYNLLLNTINEYKNNFQNIHHYNIGLGSKEEIKSMYIANNGQSSSFLKPKLHLEAHPDVYFTEVMKLQIKRADSILPYPVDFINIDVQGFELEVLKGFGELLNNAKMIYLESNIRELYEGCSLVTELDEYLLQYNFKRTYSTDMETYGWGDSIYEKAI